MAKYNPRRSQQEWLQLITECRQSGMADNAWCDQHHIPLSSFYNAITKLRKNAWAIPESTAPSDNSYTLDFTSLQDVVRVGIARFRKLRGYIWLFRILARHIRLNL